MTLTNITSSETELFLDYGKYHPAAEEEHSQQWKERLRSLNVEGSSDDPEGAIHSAIRKVLFQEARRWQEEVAL